MTFLKEEGKGLTRIYSHVLPGKKKENHQMKNKLHKMLGKTNSAGTQYKENG